MHNVFNISVSRGDKNTCLKSSYILKFSSHPIGASQPLVLIGRGKTYLGIVLASLTG